MHREPPKNRFLHPERNILYVPSWKSTTLASFPETPGTPAGSGESPSIISLPWDGIHCSCLLDHPFSGKQGFGIIPIIIMIAVRLLMLIHQYLQFQLSPKNIHSTKFRFPPLSHKCCGSGQVSASHFLLEKRIFWWFLDVVNKIVPHFG